MIPDVTKILAVQQTDTPESKVTRQWHKMTREGNMAGTKALVEKGQENRGSDTCYYSEIASVSREEEEGKSCKRVDLSSPRHGPSQRSSVSERATSSMTEALHTAGTDDWRSLTTLPQPEGSLDFIFI